MKRSKKGFIPVMLMPFKENGEIDYPGLTRMTEFYVESGAAGLFANCLSSEMFELAPAERLAATRHIVNVIKGRIPVVATGNFGATIADQAEFVKQMYDTGVEAVILVTSLLASQEEPDDVFQENTFALIGLTNKIPLGFYECPLPYKRVLTSDQLRMFLETERVIYHKDTCLNIAQVRAKIAAAEGFDFGLYDAYLGHAVESLRAGADGLSCIQGNFFPEVIVWVCENYDDPRLNEEVETVQQFLSRNMDVMHAVYPPVAKYFLQKRGMDITTYSRKNGVAINDTIRRDIDKLFDDCKMLKAELSI
jgi:4-hydroxy-tetrahydrodipicolinate synthase